MSVQWFVSSPTPHNYSKVFPSSSKHMQSNSGQCSIFEKGGRIKRKKQKKTQTPALHCPHTGRGRGEGHRDEDAEVTVSMSQVIAILSGVASRTLLQAITQLAGFSLGRLGWGLRRGLEGRGEVQGREEEAVLGTQCMPPGHSESPPWRSPEIGQVVWPLWPHNGGGGGFWGPSCAAAVATSARRNQAKTNRPHSSLAHPHKPKTPSRKG